MVPIKIKNDPVESESMLNKRTHDQVILIFNIVQHFENTIIPLVKKEWYII